MNHFPLNDCLLDFTSVEFMLTPLALRWRTFLVLLYERKKRTSFAWEAQTIRCRLGFVAAREKKLFIITVKAI